MAGKVGGPGDKIKQEFADKFWKSNDLSKASRNMGLGRALGRGPRPPDYLDGLRLHERLVFLQISFFTDLRNLWPARTPSATLID